MRKLILTIAMLGSAVAVTPALAQDYRGQQGYQQDRAYDRDQGRGFDQRRGYDSTAQLRQIGVRIDRNIRAGNLTRREAVALRREYAYLVQLDRKLSYGRASRWESATLDRRTALLERRLQQYRSNDYGDLRYGDNRRGSAALR